MARFRRHRQPPQLLVMGVAHPREERVAAPGAQRLLCRPERVTPAWSAHQREVGEIDAGGRERGRIRQVRRREPDDALARRGQANESRQHQPELADAFQVAKDLGQRARRPAAAGELGVQRRMAGGHRRGSLNMAAAAPYRRVPENLLQGGSHRYTDYIYSITPGVQSPTSLP